MMLPKLNSIWRFIGKGPGRGDVQRVIFVGLPEFGDGQKEVITISERREAWQIEWSWLGPATDFINQFEFMAYENTN